MLGGQLMPDSHFSFLIPPHVCWVGPLSGRYCVVWTWHRAHDLRGKKNKFAKPSTNSMRTECHLLPPSLLF